MKSGSGALRALCLLAAACTMTCELLASPIIAGGDAEERSATRETGPLDDSWQPDRNQVDGDRGLPYPGPKRDDTRVDRSAFGRPYSVAPFAELAPEAGAAFLGDGTDTLATRNAALAAMMRDFGTPMGHLTAAGRPGSGRANTAQIAPWEAVDTVLKMVRDSIMDDNDTANFSFAGIEFSVTLTGDRKSFALNGQEVLPSSLNGMQSDDGWRSPGYSQGAYASGMPAAIVQNTAAPRDYERAPDPVSFLKKVRDLITHPLMMMAAFVLVALWVFVRVFSSARDRQRW